MSEKAYQWRTRGRSNKAHAVKRETIGNYVFVCGITARIDNSSILGTYHCRKCEQIILQTK